jgi:hypothetical protein
MTDSILTSVKKGVGGIIEMDQSFDDDIIMSINTVFSKLTQLGVGPRKGFRITDKSTTWSDFVGDDPRLDMVKSFVVLSVRMMFDPPTNGTLAQSYEKQIAEYEWRLNVQVETPGDDESNPEPEE